MKAKMTVRTPFSSETMDAIMKTIDESGLPLDQVRVDFDPEQAEAFVFERFDEE